MKHLKTFNENIIDGQKVVDNKIDSEEYYLIEWLEDWNPHQEEFTELYLIIVPKACYFDMIQKFGFTDNDSNSINDQNVIDSLAAFLDECKIAEERVQEMDIYYTSTTPSAALSNDFAMLHAKCTPDNYIQIHNDVDD